MSPRLLAAVSLRWKAVVILAVLLPGATVAAGLTVLQRTEASVGMWASGSSAGGQTPAVARADTFARLAGTVAFAGSLRGALQRANIGTSPSDRERIATATLRDLTVTTNGTNLVELRYPCARPQECSGTLAAVVAAYNEKTASIQLSQGEQARTTLGAQVDDAQNALNQADLALSAYLAAHPGEAPSDTSADPQLDLLQSQVAAARQALTARQTKLTDLEVAAAASAPNSLSVVDAIHVSRRGLIGDGGVVQEGLVIALGILLAAGYVGFAAAHDDAARDPRALERRLQVPVLATIPRFSEMRRV